VSAPPRGPPIGFTVGRYASCKLLLLAHAQLRIASAKLLDEGRVYLYLDALHIDSLGLIPSAHLRQHLRGFEAITRASL
jgi:hypothetical protein